MSQSITPRMLTRLIHSSRYGDMQFVGFIDSVLHAAQEYFGAYLVVLSTRPTKLEGRSFSHSV